MAVWSVETR